MNETILIIDDEPSVRSVLSGAVREILKLHAVEAPSAEEALPLLEKNDYPLIITDFKMPGMTGMDLYETARKDSLCPETLFFLMTAFGDTDLGMTAVKKGFFDYIAKPFNVEDILFRIRRALDFRSMDRTIKTLSRPVSTAAESLIGSSPALKKIFTVVDQVAATEALILIEGATGTGKELVARAIHEKSGRKDNLFIPLNCGALPENLLETELFGHEKGAFTGAVTQKYGIFETAEKGTVFLDEIHNSSLGFQAKLLKFIESGEFMRVGGSKLHTCTPRILIGTNRDLEGLVEEKKFREDFFYRINVVRLKLPVLKDRLSDIPLLTGHFLAFYNRKFGKRTTLLKSAMDQLCLYPWPGNVRELKNMVQSLVLLNESGTIERDDLPEKILSASRASSNRQFKDLKQSLLERFEKNYFTDLLASTSGNVSEASRISGLSRAMLIRKIGALKLSPKKYRT